MRSEKEGLGWHGNRLAVAAVVCSEGFRCTRWMHGVRQCLRVAEMVMDGSNRVRWGETWLLRSRNRLGGLDGS